MCHTLARALVFPFLLLTLLLSLVPGAIARDWNEFGPRVSTVRDVAVSPVTGVIVSLDGEGIERSLDDGATFEPVEVSTRGRRYTVTYGADGALWVLSAGELLRSVDDGVTFTIATPPMPTGVSMRVVKVDPARPQRALVGHVDEDGVSALRVSETRDAGATWVDRTPDFWDTDSARSCLAVAIDPAGGGRLALSPQGIELLAVSSDEGQSWTAGALFFDAQDLAFAGGSLVAIDSSGMWHSSDGGLTFAAAQKSTPQGLTTLFGFGSQIEVTGDVVPRVWTLIEPQGLGYSDDLGATYQFPLPLGRNFPFGRFELAEDRRLVASWQVGLVRMTDGVPGFDQLQLAKGSTSQLRTASFEVDRRRPERMSAIAGDNPSALDTRTFLVTSEDGGGLWEPQLLDRDSALATAFDADGNRLVGFRVEPGASGDDAAAFAVEEPSGWRLIGPPNGVGADTIFTRAVAASPTQPGHYLVVQELETDGSQAEARVHSTMDGGANWTLEGSYSSVRFRGMEAVVLDGAAGSRGVVSLTRGSASFTTLVYAGDLGARSFLQVETVTRPDTLSVGPLLTASTAAPGRIWFGHATTSSFSDDGKLRYSDDGGASWTIVGDDLERFESVQPSEVEADRLYRLFDDEVWTATLPGLDWQAVATSPPPIFSDRLEVLPGDAGVVVFGSSLASNRLSPDLGDPVCSPAVFNSTGRPGVIQATGTGSATAFDVSLHAFDLPGNAFGLFLGAQDSMTPQVISGGVGRLCLGGTVIRLGQGVLSTGSTRSMKLAVDPDELLQAAGTGAYFPGTSWFFQAWYRDRTNSGIGATSNLTNAVQIVFVP